MRVPLKKISEYKHFKKETPSGRFRKCKREDFVNAYELYRSGEITTYKAASMCGLPRTTFERRMWEIYMRSCFGERGESLFVDGWFYKPGEPEQDISSFARPSNYKRRGEKKKSRVEFGMTEVSALVSKNHKKEAKRKEKEKQKYLKYKEEHRDEILASVCKEGVRKRKITYMSKKTADRMFFVYRSSIRKDMVEDWQVSDWLTHLKNMNLIYLKMV